MTGTPRSPRRRPAAPAALSTASHGIQVCGRPTSAELARTNLAPRKSAAAIPALARIVTTVVIA
jgi:hypothetical protein